MTEAKAQLYQTAVAQIACALFGAGDVVKVRFDRQSANGVFWFRVSADGDHWTAYPEHHLTRFIL